jgi:hypothetical protein
MSYGVVVAQRVSEAIGRLPFELAEQVWDQIEVLLEDPVGRGRVADYPRGSGQLFQFEAESEGRYYLFSFWFVYLDTPDENQICLTSVAVTSGDDVE